VGYELEPEFAEVFDDRVGAVPEMSRSVVARRLDRHREFVADRRADGDTLSYEADHYEFPVRTKQEQGIRLYTVEDVDATDEGYCAAHAPVTEDDLAAFE